MFSPRIDDKLGIIDISVMFSPGIDDKLGIMEVYWSNV